MRSIQDYIQKIKAKREFLLLIIIITGLSTIIAIISFLLGRESALQTYKQPIFIEYPPLITPYDTSIEYTQNTVTGQYVASKNGTKYYSPDCSGSSRIKEENKVFFNSSIAAENAGYDLAASCL